MSRNIFWAHANNQLLIWVSKEIKQSKMIAMKYVPPSNIIIIPLKDILTSPGRYQVYNLRIKATPLKWINTLHFPPSFAVSQCKLSLGQAQSPWTCLGTNLRVPGTWSVANNWNIHVPSFLGCRADEKWCLCRCSQWGKELDTVSQSCHFVAAFISLLLISLQLDQQNERELPPC